MRTMKGESKGLGLKRLLLLGGAVVLIIVVVLAMRGGNHANTAAEATEPEIVVETMTVALEALPDEVSASGTVRPVVESTIAPKIMSNVSAVYVREGDHVRKGQLLVKLESSDLLAQVAQAEAALAAAVAGSRRAYTAVDLQKVQTSTGIAGAEAALKAAREQLSIAKEGPRRQQKAQAHLAVAQAEAQFKNAQIEYDRMNRLHDQGAVPKARLDGARMMFDVAKAQHESAKEHASMADEGSREQEVRTAQEQVRQAEEALRMAKAAVAQNAMSSRNAESAASQVEQARAAVRFARVQLGYASITSPISGVVTSRMVDPGDMVSPGVPIVAVEDDSLYRLEATVAANDVENLTKGKEVDVAIGSRNRRGRGKVSVISPSGDPGSRKFLVKIDLPGGLGSKSGDFGRVSFPVGYTKGIVVPERVVHYDGGLAKVFVVGDDGKAAMRVVKTGRKLTGGLEIVSGLESGDSVILENTGVLADGVRVRAEGG